jgi:uncharacterized protein (DUF169 family)
LFAHQGVLDVLLEGTNDSFWNHKCLLSTVCITYKKNSRPTDTGEFLFNIGMYESPNAAAKITASRPSLEIGSMLTKAVARLSKAALDPDVVVVAGTPEQVIWISTATSTFQDGGRVRVEMAAVHASCVDLNCGPLRHRQH